MIRLRLEMLAPLSNGLIDDWRGPGMPQWNVGTPSVIPRSSAGRIRKRSWLQKLRAASVSSAKGGPRKFSGRLFESRRTSGVGPEHTWPGCPLISYCGSLKIHVGSPWPQALGPASESRKAAPDGKRFLRFPGQIRRLRQKRPKAFGCRDRNHHRPNSEGSSVIVLAEHGVRIGFLILILSFVHLG